MKAIGSVEVPTETFVKMITREQLETNIFKKYKEKSEVKLQVFLFFLCQIFDLQRYFNSNGLKKIDRDL